MAVISELFIDEDKITHHEYSTIREITADGVNYHFAENTESSKICLNAVEEPIVDLKVDGDSVQEGEPTPETPVEIESVGEKTNNLLNKATSEESKTINSSGVVLDANYGLSVTQPIYIIPNTTYVYSGMGNVVGTTVGRTGFMYEKDGTPIKTVGSSDGRTIWFTPPENCAYVRLIYKSIEEQPMLIENKKYEEDKYEPYGYKVPINVRGKNIFNINGSPGDVTNCTYTVEGNTLTLKPIKDLLTRLTLRFDVKKNTNYVISGVFEMFNSSEYSGGCTIFIRETAIGGTLIKSYPMQIKDGEQNILIKFNSGEYSTLYFWFYYNQVNSGTQVNGNSYGVYKNIQIEEGDTPTEYEPYFEPMTTNIYLNEPLRKVGDYVDYIDYKNKKVVRNIYGEYITTISGKSSSSNVYSVFTSSIKQKPLYSSDKGFCISNKFLRHEDVYWKLGVQNGGYIQPYISSSNANLILFSFKDTSINTAALAQEKIGEGFDVCYVLATPIEETIVIPEISTFKGPNVFDIETTIQPMAVKINYWKQI